MLQELIVKDFAIIDSLTLSFMKGLNMLTGETGAGKSIIVGALGLLMGGRASAELIRTGSEEALVEAVFNIHNNPEIKNIFLSWDMESDADQVLIRRTISKTGKNRIIINDRLATTQMLAQLGGRLIDISGQYSQQLLLQEERHIDILDSFGGLSQLRDHYHTLYTAFQDKTSELKTLVTNETSRVKRQELLEFQNKEIEQACLSVGEEQELLAEKLILANATILYEKTYGAYINLYENDNACLTVLKQLLHDLEEACSVDPGITPLKDNLESSFLTIEDTAFSLRTYAKNIIMDPARLESVESRLDMIHRLKNKYGDSIEQIIAYQKEIQRELETIDVSSSRITMIRDELSICGKQLWSVADELSNKRKNAALLLKKKVEKELDSIGMKKATFFVHIKSTSREESMIPESLIHGLNSTGKDSVQFYISPNQGEDSKPLSRIASGGEISRIVLAIKKIIAGTYKVPTLLFDEVDAGIGGAVAEAVGSKLHEIAATHQVLCITHLPQIACFGTYHYSVKKSICNGRTLTSVELLDERGRIDELARMLGGKNISDKTIAYAKEMLKHSRNN